MTDKQVSCMDASELMAKYLELQATCAEQQFKMEQMQLRSSFISRECLNLDGEVRSKDAVIKELESKSLEDHLLIERLADEYWALTDEVKTLNVQLKTSDAKPAAIRKELDTWKRRNIQLEGKIARADKQI